MGTKRQSAQIPVELATVERLDSIIARRVWGMDTYTAVIRWAADVAAMRGTPGQWAHAERDEVHRAATDGPLVLIDVDNDVRLLLRMALGAAQGIVTYVPTYATAIGWLLDVAQAAGYPAPGESQRARATG